MDKKFSYFWTMTAYSEKVDKKPTVHSPRQTFVVSKMNEWMNEGKDYGAMMPYLSRYYDTPQLMKYNIITISLYPQLR